MMMILGSRPKIKKKYNFFAEIGSHFLALCLVFRLSSLFAASFLLFFAAAAAAAVLHSRCRKERQYGATFLGLLLIQPPVVVALVETPSWLLLAPPRQRLLPLDPRIGWSLP